MAQAITTSQPYKRNDQTAISTENVERVLERRRKRMLGGRLYKNGGKTDEEGNADDQQHGDEGGDDSEADTDPSRGD